MDRILQRMMGLFMALLIMPAAWADGEIYFGIYQGSGTLKGYGTGKAETYDVAIHLTDPSLAGMEIRAIRIPVNSNAKNATDYKGWLSKELTLVSSKMSPDIVSVEATPSGTWAEARLSEPYVITEDGLYVGYSFTVSSVDAANTSDANKTPVMTTATENPEGLLIHTSRTYRKWVALAELGSPAVVVLIGGEGVKEHAAVLQAPDDLYTTTGSTISTTLTLVNHGSGAISNIEYEIEANGQTETRQLTRSLAGQYYGRSTTFTATIPAIATAGTYATTFRVTKVNGVENEDPVGAFTVPVTYLDEVPVHRPLVEEYTGTWCQWCPRGLACMERMTDLQGDKFVGVAYHMSDVMDFAVSYYPVGSAELGLPAAFIDRAASYDLSDGRTAWQQRSNIIACADIAVAAEWADEAKTQIRATSTTTFVRDFGQNNCLVGYILLANDMHREGDSQWYQSNAFSGNQGYSTGDKYLQKYIDSPNPMKDYHFDHVAIAQSLNYGAGVPGSLPASVKEYTPYTHTYTFDISGNTLPLDKAKMDVVAVLVDTETGQVVNCNKVHVTDADGIEGISLSANSYTRIYGEENPTFGYTADGELEGVPIISCEATTTSPVGQYPIVIERGSVTDAIETLVCGTLTITPAPLTITAKSYSRSQGEENPEFEVTYTGFKNGENDSVLTKRPTVTCSATASSPVGTYDIVPSGAQAQNYSISYANGVLAIGNFVSFADDEVRRICVEAWDTDGDGFLSRDEAAAVTDIGTRFRNSSITSFNELRNFTGLTSIPAYAFSGCTALESLVIPESVTSIGDYALGTGASLKSLTIGSGVQNISTYAFRKSSSATATKPIKTIWLTNTPPTYYSYAEGTVNYVSNDLYTSLSNKTVYPFLSSMFEVDGVRYVPVSPSERTCDAIDCRYGSSTASVNIGETVEYQGIAMTVKNVKPYSCYRNNNITEVQLSFGGDIGENAFYGCTNLQDVTVSNQGYIGASAFYGSRISSRLSVSNAGDIGESAFASVTGNFAASINNAGVIAASAFKNSSGLNTLEIGEAVTSIGANAFQSCTALQTATLGTGITAIGDYAFDGCSSLQSIVVPNAVRSLGSYAFQNCSKMASVKLGSGLTAVNNYTFSGCSSLTDMQIGEHVKTIGTYAFQSCTSLPEIIIPKVVASIGNYAFSGCKALKNVVMEDQESELTLGSNGSSPLFADCPLDSVYIGRNISYQTNSSYGYSPFYRNTSLRSIHITDKETEISGNEFYGCTNLKNVRIGDGVTTIGRWAFSGCSSLDYFAFGSSVESIGQEAFSDCTAMTHIISRAETPPTCGTQALDDINKWTCHLSVLPGTADAYQTAAQWKEFFFIEETAQGDKTVESVTINEHALTIETIGGTAQLTATVQPYAAKNREVTWSSDNEDVATVSDGLVTAIGYGTAHVIVRSEENAEIADTCLITVRMSWADVLAELQTAIAQAQDLYENSTEGTQTGQYPEGARAELQEAIEAATTVAETSNDYDAIVQGIADLNEAMETFKGKMVTETPRNMLSVDPVTVNVGKNVVFSIDLTNEDGIIMTEFYLQLPDGMSIAKDEDDYYDVMLNSARQNRHILEVDLNSEGLYHFLCYSTKNNALKGNEGELFTVNLTCDENIETGTYQAIVKNIIMADTDRKEVRQENFTFAITAMDVMMGDVNGDGKINGLDIVELVDCIMGRESETLVREAADLTGDGEVNGMDLVELVSLVMSQGTSTSAVARIKALSEHVGLTEGLVLKAEADGMARLGVASAKDFILTQCIVEVSNGMELTHVTSDAHHHVVWQPMGNGRYLVLAYSTQNSSFDGNDALLTLAYSGEGEICVRKTMLVDAERQGMDFAPVALGRETGIGLVNSDGENTVFDLQGRKLNGKIMQKGVYVVNGNKILVK